MINKTEWRGARRAGLVATAMAGIMLCLAAGGGYAMPVETDSITDIPGVTKDGELDIREVLDNSTEMDIRLTKQIMLLQRQINQLKRKIEILEAADAE